MGREQVKDPGDATFLETEREIERNGRGLSKKVERICLDISTNFGML